MDSIKEIDLDQPTQFSGVPASHRLTLLVATGHKGVFSVVTMLVSTGEYGDKHSKMRG